MLRMEPKPSNIEDLELYNRIQGHSAYHCYSDPRFMKKERLSIREREVIEYIKGTRPLEEVAITKLNAPGFLRIVKIVDLTIKTGRSSFPLRQRILELSSPFMSTCQAYTLTTDPQKMGDLDYLCQPKNWVPEAVGRQALAITAQFAKIVGFSKQNRTPIFYAIRGNTGAGKTTFLQNMFKEEVPCLNLDPLKYFLKRNIKLTNVQVYEEANALFANFLNGVFKQKDLRFIFDSRLLTVEYIEKNVLTPAELRGEEVQLIDIEVPLTVSLLRSLVRDPYGKDACVPPDAIEYGFIQIRQERSKLISLVKDNPRITSYKLYCENVLIAEKKNGFHIYHPEMYAESLRIPSQEEVSDSLNAIIDSARAPIYPSQREALAKWEGRRLGEALRLHAFQMEETPGKEQYEVPGDDILLAKYEKFYRKMATKLVLEYLNGNGVLKGESIFLKNGDYFMLPRLFVAIPIILRDEEMPHRIISISFRIDMSYEEHFLTDILEYAKEHEDPVRFLIDHYRFWSFRLPYVMQFLSDYPENFGVMDIFERVVIDKYRSFGALAKAWKVPAAKARAEELFAKLDEHLLQAPDFWDENVLWGYNEIAEDCPDPTRRFRAELTLEAKRGLGLPQIETAICQEILSSALMDEHLFEETVWAMPEYAFSAIQALGGRKITDRLCEILLEGDEVDSIASILKYIAMKTKDRSESDQIINAMSGRKVTEIPAHNRDRWEEMYHALLEKALRNPALPCEMRITALRYCAIELFIPENSTISSGQHKKRAIAKSALTTFLADPATPKSLRLEASRIQKWLTMC